MEAVNSLLVEIFPAFKLLAEGEQALGHIQHLNMSYLLRPIIMLFHPVGKCFTSCSNTFGEEMASAFVDSVHQSAV